MLNAIDALGLAKELQNDIVRLGFNSPDSCAAASEQPALCAFVLDADLKAKTEKLFVDGHYARAVEEAYKFIDNLVKRRVSSFCKATTGASLMRAALSPNRPILLLNENSTEVEVDEQQGYMDIFAGCMTGIRNPRAHDTDLEDDRDYALKLLSWADHLVARIKNSRVADGLERKH